MRPPWLWQSSAIGRSRDTRASSWASAAFTSSRYSAKRSTWPRGPCARPWPRVVERERGQPGVAQHVGDLAVAAAVLGIAVQDQRGAARLVRGEQLAVQLGAVGGVEGERRGRLDRAGAGR